MSSPLDVIPFEVYLIASFALMISGLYMALTRAKYYLEITIVTTILAPLPAIIAMYIRTGPSYYFYLVLMVYAFIIMAVSLPAITGQFPEYLRKVYRYTKMYYFSILSKEEFIGHIDIGRLTDHMVIYTYLIILMLPFLVGILLFLGYPLFAILVAIVVSAIVVYLPRLTLFLIETGYVSGLDDELPQVIQILMVHHRSGETILEALENIAKSEENLPYWSKLSRALLLNARISGLGIHRTILDWISKGGGTERVRNFLEGYVYTWVAGGDLEAYLKRWLEDEQNRWVDRIKGYYNKILGFAQIALIIAVSPIAILLISFLNPAFGVLSIQLMILFLPLILYFIPSIYLNSIRPRMANTPSYKPSLLYIGIAIAPAIAILYFVPDDFMKVSGAVLAVSVVLLPFELGWRGYLKRIEEGILRWIETSMHYMLAGVTPIDAVKRAKDLIRDDDTLKLANRLMYNVELGKSSIKTPLPLITHVLHVLGTGILTGGISPDILYVNLNTIYRVKRAIEESRANVISALVLGILSPIMIWLTMGIGEWFVGVLSIIPQDAAGFAIPLFFADVDVDFIIFLLKILSLVMVFTIGAIASKIYTNYSHSPMIHTPLILTLTVLFIIGIEVMVEYFQSLIGF